MVVNVTDNKDVFFLWIHSQRFFFEVCLVNGDRPCPRPLTFSEYIFLLDKNKVHGQYYPICIFFRPERKEKIFYTAKNKSRKGCSRHEEEKKLLWPIALFVLVVLLPS